MFSKLLNEKNRYALINIIFVLISLVFFLLNIAILKDVAISLIASLFLSLDSNMFLTIVLILYTGLYGIYVIFKLVNHKVIINGSIVYLSFLINTIQLFNIELMNNYYSNIINTNIPFIDKFIMVVSIIVISAISLYTFWLLIKYIWGIIKRKIIDFEAPKINSNELLQAIGLYYLDFEYNKNLSYYVTYESNGKIIKEDLTPKKILCLVGDLLPNEEYDIKLYSLGKIKAKFIALESNETIKFTLNKKPSELQERIAYYYHYSPELIDCYIETLQVFDKMFKRLLIYSPEVMIIESLNKKTIFAKIYLDKENIIVRFNANPYLLEEEFNVVNSFEEDCMYPTKYIIRTLNDVEYMKKIVEKIKSFKK